MNGCVQVPGVGGSPAKGASEVSQYQAGDSILLTNKDQSGGKSQALTLDTQKQQPAASNLIAISKPSAQKEKLTAGQDSLTGNNFSHNNDERSTGEISNQGQPVVPLNAPAVAPQRQPPVVVGNGTQAAQAPAGPLAAAQLQQLMLQMQMFQQSLPTGQVAAANGLPAMAPLQGGAAEQQNYLNLMMMNMLSRQLGDPGSIPVPTQPEVPQKKKKHQSQKNGGAADGALQGQLKRQKVENDDGVILVQSTQANNVDAVQLVDTEAKEENDKSMLINIGIGPTAGGSKRKRRSSSSRSSSYASSSSSRKSSDESREDDPSGSHSQSGSNSRSQQYHSSQAQSVASGDKKKGRRNQSSTPASEYGGEESVASKSLSERRADKLQAKQKAVQQKVKDQKEAAKAKAAVNDDKDKMTIVATLTKTQTEPSQPPVKRQQAEVTQKPLEVESSTNKNQQTIMSNSEMTSAAPKDPQQLTGSSARVVEERSSSPVRQEQATTPAPLSRPPRPPQKMLTPYEKILKMAASEARTFNRDFDFHMRQKNREYFQAQSLVTARTERATLDSFGARKRHTQFLTNFYQHNHHGHGSHLPSASCGPGSKEAPICLPFYNQLNAISHHLVQHQQKRSMLPSGSSQALKDTMADLQRRKDELIRQRYGLRQCQKKIFDFHLEQMEKRSKNFDTFTLRHQEHWKEIKDSRDSIIEETRRAERELQELLQKEEEEPVPEVYHSHHPPHSELDQMLEPLSDSDQEYQDLEAAIKFHNQAEPFPAVEKIQSQQLEKILEQQQDSVERMPQLNKLSQQQALQLHESGEVPPFFGLEEQDEPMIEAVEQNGKVEQPEQPVQQDQQVQHYHQDQMVQGDQQVMPQQELQEMPEEVSAGAGETLTPQIAIEVDAQKVEAVPESVQQQQQLEVQHQPAEELVQDTDSGILNGFDGHQLRGGADETTKIEVANQKVPITEDLYQAEPQPQLPLEASDLAATSKLPPPTATLMNPVEQQATDMTTMNQNQADPSLPSEM